MKSSLSRQKADPMIEQSLQDETVSEVLSGVQLPLENIEYTIEQYLLANGARLDTETRFLLAGVRDCVGRVAGSTRRVTERARDPRQRRLPNI